MDTQSRQHKLTRVVAAILQDAAFIFAEEAEGPVPFQSDVLVARIDFGGPETGTVVLAAPYDFAVGVARNLIDLEVGDADAKQKVADAFNELANILVGAIVHELHGDDVRASMGLPRQSTMAAVAYEAELAKASLRITLVTEERHRIDVALLLR